MNLEGAVVDAGPKTDVETGRWRRRTTLALVAVGLCIAFAGCGRSVAEDGATSRAESTEAPTPGPMAERFFSPSSFWNTPLSNSQPLDPASDRLVARLGEEVAQHGAWMNVDAYSTPLYVVPRDQPRIRVTIDHEYPPMQEQANAVPIPDDARPAPGTDAHLTIWQPSTDTLWELWASSVDDDGWRARSAGMMRNVSTSEGIFPSPFGATATGLPVIGGTVTLGDLAAGRIDHVLAMSNVEPRAGWWSLPAQRTDGWVDREDAVPEGIRLRLDPNLDLASLDLPAPTRMLADAAQRYGIVIRDQAETVTFYGEQPTTQEGGEAWERWFAGHEPEEVAAAFPWEHLQALPLRLRTWNP